MSGVFDELDRVGLNLHAVIALDALPAALREALVALAPADLQPRQLILVAAAGARLWQAVQQAGPAATDPIDGFSVERVRAWFARCCPGRRAHWLYPGRAAVDLQALGRLAGWHHDSPLRLGMHPRWGSWFGYRAALLADSALAPTPPVAGRGPCEGCATRPCVAACPAGALAQGRLDLARCIAQRRRPGSPCALDCAARSACPAGAEARYAPEQIRHAYAESLRAIERHLDTR